MGNDTTILMTIMVLLVGIGFISPLIQDATNQGILEQDVDLYINDTLSEDDMPSTTNWLTGGGWGIFGNIFKALLWYFDWFPTWLTIFHVVIRFILVIIIYRLVRSGAG